MNYTITELIFFYLIYSFAGWVLETVYAAVSKKRFANRGFLNGAICPTYGISVIIVALLFEPANEGIIFTYIASTVVATMVEYITAAFCENYLHKKYWDYSGERFNIAGRVCFKYSIIWGVLLTVAIKLIHPLFISLIRWINNPVISIAIWIIFGISIIDFIVTLCAVVYGKDQGTGMVRVSSGLRRNKSKLAAFITNYIDRRLIKAYPDSKKEYKEEVDKVAFAKGCGFYKLIWLFMIGAFVGDIVETIYCYITSGVIMSRSSVIYGPFSVVWGGGIVLFTPILYRFKDMNDRHVFIAGTVLGGVYEYACSVFTEICFGTVFWDYSEIPFNLGGRINLLYCFFWGIAALVWVKMLYPFLSKNIEKIPIRIGTVISWVMLIFMIFNITISMAALARYDERANDIPANNRVRVFLDEHYDDKRMEKVYPNAMHR